MAKNKKQPPAKKKRAISPARELKKVRGDISKARAPIYRLNSKIRNAPSKYQAGKLRKQKKGLLAKIEPALSELISKRNDLSVKAKKYAQNVKKKKSEFSKVYSLERKIKNAVDNKDLKQAEKLRYQLLKHLGEIDRLRKEMGVIEDGKGKPIAEPGEDAGGKDYVLDSKSPYAIWEAIKQLHVDLDDEFFQFFIVNGKRFKRGNEDLITAEASSFWISAKEKTDGTPLVDRYVNFKTKSVKYLHRYS